MSNYIDLLDAQPGKDEKQSVKEKILSLCIHMVLWHSPEKEAFATCSVAGIHQDISIKSLEFSQFLRKLYYEKYKGIPSEHSLKECLSTLEGKARYEGEEYPVFSRIGRYGDTIYIDLVDKEGTIVEIDAKGWRVLNSHSQKKIKFCRNSSMRPLPRPSESGGLDQLRQYINVTNDDEYHLIIAWILQCFNVGTSCPILILNGEQGTAKSTTTRLIRDLIDPSVPNLLACPKQERDFVAVARNNYIIALDNMSDINDDLSDRLCRLSTGGGLGGRKLYTDHDQCVVDVKRPIILNGIPTLVTRADLADRCIRIELNRISNKERQSENDFFENFKRDQPLILGGFLNILVGILKDAHNVNPPELPRMADFAIFLEAAEPYLKWPPGTFRRIYNQNKIELAESILSDNPVAQAITELMKARENWSGTASTLLRDMKENNRSDIRYQLPRTPQHLSTELSRLAPDLEKIGIKIQKKRNGTGRTLIIKKASKNIVIAVTPIEQQHYRGSSSDSEHDDDLVDHSALSPPEERDFHLNDDDDDEFKKNFEFYERAAIMEYDAGLSRHEAERLSKIAVGIN
jgi:putative DNA primase/helicase